MAETVIRPTLKFVYLGYFLVIVVVVGAVLAFTRFPMPSAIPSSWQPWIPWASLVLLIWPVRRHLRNRLTKMTILDDKLRYERGFFNRSTRTIPLAKVQDVTVYQRIGQRLFDVGDLSIETAGEASRETIFNIDRPKEVADIINECSQRGIAQGADGTTLARG